MNAAILLVDDEPHMRHLIEFNLRKIGLPVVQASSGAEALHRFSEGRFALAIIDVMLGEVDGFDVVRSLRALEHGACLPVIMLTSRGLPDTKDRAAAAGVSTFLTKPFSPGELQAHVRRLLQPAP